MSKMHTEQTEIDLTYAKSPLFLRQTVAVSLGIPIDREFTGNQNKIVAIDIETGSFEVAEDLVTAAKHLSARVPDAQTWFVRVGHQELVGEAYRR